MTLPEMTELMRSMDQPAYRARQLMEDLYRGLALHQMHRLPAKLREALASVAEDRPLTITQRHVSAQDGTVKMLYELRDGQLIEGVLMRHSYGLTLCLSTQAGCRMGCLFCASTLSGRARDLTPGEMMAQVIQSERAQGGERIGHIVLMGTGEPLDNYRNTVRFLRLCGAPEALGISLRGVSLSTCGLAPEIIALADEGLPVTLSISLHAPDDETRARIMPIAKRIPLGELMDACKTYLKKTGRRVIFEYALIEGVNCELSHARRLAALLRGMQCHVNLIMLNPVRERGLTAPDERKAALFQKELESLHISVTRRRRMGDDIEGACGQLRRASIQEKASENDQTEGGTARCDE